MAICEAANLVRMRLLIEAGDVREWYLGERVTRQSIVALQYFVTQPQPSQMRVGEYLVYNEVDASLTSEDIVSYLLNQWL